MNRPAGLRSNTGDSSSLLSAKQQLREPLEYLLPRFLLGRFFAGDLHSFNGDVGDLIDLKRFGTLFAKGIQNRVAASLPFPCVAATTFGLRRCRSESPSPTLTRPQLGRVPCTFKEGLPLGACSTSCHARHGSKGTKAGSIGRVCGCGIEHASLDGIVSSVEVEAPTASEVCLPTGESKSIESSEGAELAGCKVENLRGSDRIHEVKNTTRLSLAEELADVAREDGSLDPLMKAPTAAPVDASLSPPLNLKCISGPQMPALGPPLCRSLSFFQEAVENAVSAIGVDLEASGSGSVQLPEMPSHTTCVDRFKQHQSTVSIELGEDAGQSQEVAANSILTFEKQTSTTSLEANKQEKGGLAGIELHVRAINTHMQNLVNLGLSPPEIFPLEKSSALLQDIARRYSSSSSAFPWAGHPPRGPVGPDEMKLAQPTKWLLQSLAGAAHSGRSEKAGDSNDFTQNEGDSSPQQSNHANSAIQVLFGAEVAAIEKHLQRLDDLGFAYNSHRCKERSTSSPRSDLERAMNQEACIDVRDDLGLPEASQGPPKTLIQLTGESDDLSGRDAEAFQKQPLLPQPQTVFTLPASGTPSVAAEEEVADPTPLSTSKRGLLNAGANTPTAYEQSPKHVKIQISTVSSGKLKDTLFRSNRAGGMVEGGLSTAAAAVSQVRSWRPRRALYRADSLSDDAFSHLIANTIGDELSSSDSDWSVGQVELQDDPQGPPKTEGIHPDPNKPATPTRKSSSVKTHTLSEAPKLPDMPLTPRSRFLALSTSATKEEVVNVCRQVGTPDFLSSIGKKRIPFRTQRALVRHMAQPEVIIVLELLAAKLDARCIEQMSRLAKASPSPAIARIFVRWLDSWESTERAQRESASTTLNSGYISVGQRSGANGSLATIGRGSRIRLGHSVTTSFDTSGFLSASVSTRRSRTSDSQGLSGAASSSLQQESQQSGTLAAQSLASRKPSSMTIDSDVPNSFLVLLLSLGDRAMTMLPREWLGHVLLQRVLVAPLPSRQHAVTDKAQVYVEQWVRSMTSYSRRLILSQGAERLPLDEKQWMRYVDPFEKSLPVWQGQNALPYPSLFQIFVAETLKTEEQRQLRPGSSGKVAAKSKPTGLRKRLARAVRGLLSTMDLGASPSHQS